MKVSLSAQDLIKGTTLSSVIFVNEHKAYFKELVSGCFCK